MCWIFSCLSSVRQSHLAKQRKSEIESFNMIILIMLFISVQQIQKAWIVTFRACRCNCFELNKNARCSLCEIWFWYVRGMIYRADCCIGLFVTSAYCQILMTDLVPLCCGTLPILLRVYKMLQHLKLNFLCSAKCTLIVVSLLFVVNSSLTYFDLWFIIDLVFILL